MALVKMILLMCFLTHLHFDHCGGSIVRENDKLVPAFKNATYWSNKEHWDWAVFPNDREKASFLKENILPIEESGQLKFVDVCRWSMRVENWKFSFSAGNINYQRSTESISANKIC